VTVSEYSRRDIINQFDVPEDKVDLVYNGANEMYKPISEERKMEIRQARTAGSPYFLFVGSLHPRKNLTNLLKAFQLFRDEFKNDYKMVIVGKKFYLNKPMDEQLEKMKNSDDVIFTGRLSPEELSEVMGAASALTFVPYFEGFGIPLIEAMNCDLPVITSNVTSLPEIAGDAALYAEPASPGSIRDAMVRVVKEKDTRAMLIAKGRERRAMFSWDKTAEGLWATIENVLNEHA
jgi:glycosyltransferase involved in cell wall biosynthesis